jgi:hypothetical protein
MLSECNFNDGVAGDLQGSLNSHRRLSLKEASGSSTTSKEDSQSRKPLKEASQGSLSRKRETGRERGRERERERERKRRSTY